MAITGFPESNPAIEIIANGKTYRLGSCVGDEGAVYPLYRGTALSVSEGATFALQGDLDGSFEGRSFPAAFAAASRATAPGDTLTFEMTSGTMSYPSAEDDADGQAPGPTIPGPDPNPTDPSPPEPSPTEPTRPDQTPRPTTPDDTPPSPDETDRAPRSPEGERGTPSRPPEEREREPATGNGSAPSDAPAPKNGAFSPDGPPAPEFDYSDPVPQPPNESSDSPDQISGDPTVRPEAQPDDADPTTGSGLSPFLAVPLVAVIVLIGLFLIVLAMRRRKKGAHEA